MNDYVSVKDKARSNRSSQATKVTPLRVSIQELHDDLIDQLPEASKDGIP
eukprot:CAMPEP_0201152536 /NCGR_PEP_ID=MMETSP0851-20130426/13186_1 /ASSEMBLY_ACC=CAM_ASM_000631 /TAXON_ID=183588 /ORGANISM="Pseudo-nitzschia fraudulenta, Strain WWA7" /LENGTH=49 /DNA_ID= /DNA_START= /DNA_END= /DNA_ORIENTATION=